jgi:hypothetical protein
MPSAALARFLFVRGKDHYPDEAFLKESANFLLRGLVGSVAHMRFADEL